MLVVGLCNSGKTSIVKALAGQVVADAVPTAGFEVETFKLSGKDKVKFTTYDMSGDPKYRCLWDSFYADAQVRRRVCTQNHACMHMQAWRMYAQPGMHGGWMKLHVQWIFRHGRHRLAGGVKHSRVWCACGGGGRPCESWSVTHRH